MVYIIIFSVLFLLMSGVMYWAVGVGLREAIREKDPGTIFSWSICIIALAYFDYFILSTIWKYWYSLSL